VHPANPSIFVCRCWSASYVDHIWIPMMLKVILFPLNDDMWEYAVTVTTFLWSLGWHFKWVVVICFDEGSVFYDIVFHIYLAKAFGIWGDTNCYLWSFLAVLMNWGTLAYAVMGYFCVLTIQTCLMCFTAICKKWCCPAGFMLLCNCVILWSSVP